MISKVGNQAKIFLFGGQMGDVKYNLNEDYIRG